MPEHQPAQTAPSSQLWSRPEPEPRPLPSSPHAASPQLPAPGSGTTPQAGRLFAGLYDAEPLPADVLSRLRHSFGELPPFNVAIDPGKVPEGGRAASSGTNIFLRSEADKGDVQLIAHEMTHVIQSQRNGKHSSHDQGPKEAGSAVSEGGAINAAPSHGPADERGTERQELEDHADAAAAAVAAGQKIADLSTTPVIEGETYLKPPPGHVPAKSVHLVLFPGETSEPTGYGGEISRGHLYVYVKGKLVKSYEACGGPAPGHGSKGPGGHSAGSTPAGDYVLSAPEHHATQNWPHSVVPWGAKLRERSDQEVEYSKDGGKTWLPATGSHGDVTKAFILFEERTRAQEASESNRRQARQPGYKPVKPAPLTDEEKASLNEQARELFHEGDKLMDEYTKNDFGKWAFNMTKSGSKRTAYYVHTTPEDEKATDNHAGFELSQSHGCVHIRPADRAEMMDLGYLQRGVRMTVKKYGIQGP